MIDSTEMILQTDSSKAEDDSMLLQKMHERFEPWQNLVINYQCAVMEVETKFRVLNNRLSMQGERNPIESIKSRIKQPDSILKKIKKHDLPMTMESVENNIFDVAGVRVICSFIDDIYEIEKLFLEQEDIELIKRKDYIENPKPSGYRSLHLIVRTPIYTENGKKNMFVEVQLRTIAMDFWATLEHKLRYKKNIDSDLMQELSYELQSCAEESSQMDLRMQAVRKKLDNASLSEK